MASNSTAVALRTPLDAELCVLLVASLAKFLLFMRGQVPWCVLQLLPRCIGGLLAASKVTNDSCQRLCSVLDELERLVNAYKQQQQQDQVMRRRAAGGAMRKAIKCVDALERVLQEGLPAVFAGPVRTGDASAVWHGMVIGQLTNCVDCRDVAVAIVFGASLLSPREVVVVDFKDVARVDLMEAGSIGANSNSAASNTTSALPPDALSNGKLGRLCVQKLLRTLIVDGACQRTRWSEWSLLGLIMGVHD
jgi:hypothetical protein